MLHISAQCVIMKKKFAHLIIARSIKINYILNLLRVLSAALVGIFTLPYLTRVLGAENLGRVEYVYTIINYFILFSALGIPMYGIREVSKSRGNPRELFKVVAELYLLLLITTVISYAVLFGILMSLDVFGGYKSLLILMSSMVILSNMGAEWYFQGIENQLYITVRYVAVRLVIFFLFFLLIKVPEDYTVYAVLLVILNFGANILNFVLISRKISKADIRFADLDIQRHFRPVLTIFVATLAVNIYLQLDIFLIGFIAGDEYVGYYMIANKLIRHIISFITIIGAVLLPRLSYLYSHDRVLYEFYLAKSFNVIMLFAIPFSIYFFIFSDTIVMLMAGPAFSSSVLTMQILSPLCIVVCLAYFMGFLILYPQNREKVYTKATVIAAMTSISVNYFAIQTYFQNGAAVVAVAAEVLAILIMYHYCLRNSLFPKVWNYNFLKISVISLSLLAAGYFLVFGTVYSVAELGLYSFLFFIIYYGALLVSGEHNTQSVYHYLQSKLVKNADL